MKIFKKILCTFLIVMIYLTAVPLGGNVAIELPDFSEWFVSKASAAGELAVTGECGDNVYWSFDESKGELTISGVGDMWDYDGLSDEEPSYSGHRDCVTSVIIENGVTSVGGEAISFLDKLTSVTIAETVAHIGDFAFASCYYLESITIPKGVASISENAFDECARLEKILVDVNNTTFSNDEYGVLFNKDKTCLIKYPFGNKNESYTIPDSVTTIDRLAFKCCRLKSIIIPDSVVTIEYGAFYGCSNLSQVIRGTGVKKNRQ